MEEEEEDSSLVCPSEDGGRSVGRAIETCQRQLVPGVPQRALPAKLYSQKWTRLSGGDATVEMCRRALLPTLPTVQEGRKNRTHCIVKQILFSRRKRCSHNPSRFLYYYGDAFIRLPFLFGANIALFKSPHYQGCCYQATLSTDFLCTNVPKSICNCD